jgi:hypothetical protein
VRPSYIQDSRFLKVNMGQYDIFLVDSYFLPFRLLYNGLLVEGCLAHKVETSPLVKMSFQTALLYKIKSEKTVSPFCCDKFVFLIRFVGPSGRGDQLKHTCGCAPTFHKCSCHSCQWD